MLKNHWKLAEESLTSANKYLQVFPDAFVMIMIIVIAIIIMLIIIIITSMEV